MFRRPDRTPIALLAAVALAGAGCGGGEGQPAERPPAESEPAPAATSPAQLARKVSEKTSSKPEIPKPAGDPPTELVVRDIVKGKGAPVRGGDRVTVDYVGVSWSSGQEFDASWDRGEPFAFGLGAGEVIAGWDEGVAGMRKGGRRMLVIPPGMAYGPQGQPPAIAPNETLVFVVDLRKGG